MPQPDLIMRVLERFAALAKASDKADANVLAAITAAITEDPGIVRTKLLAVAKEAVEDDDGSID